MVPEGSKRSLNLSIDYVHETQRLLGYRTLNLLNANGDPTFLRPVLYTEIAKHYYPTPSANYIRVVINGEYWGVYVNPSSSTLTSRGSGLGARRVRAGKSQARRGDGEAWSIVGENVDAYRTIYEIKSKDDPAAWRSLVRMFRVLNETRARQAGCCPCAHARRGRRIQVPRVEMALANSDGYWARASDYNLYMDEAGAFTSSLTM